MRITKKQTVVNKNLSPCKENPYLNKEFNNESNLDLLSNKSSHQDSVNNLLNNQITLSINKTNNANETVSPEKEYKNSEQTTPKFPKPQIKSYQKVNIGSLKTQVKKVNEVIKATSQNKISNLKNSNLNAITYHSNKDTLKVSQRAQTPIHQSDKISYALRKNYIVPNPKANLNRSKSVNRDSDERNNRSFTESSVNKANRLDTSYDKMNKTVQALNQKTKNSLSFSVDKGFSNNTLTQQNKKNEDDDRATLNQKKNILSMKLEKLKKKQQDKKLQGNVIFNGNNPYSVKATNISANQSSSQKINIPNIIKNQTTISPINSNNYTTTNNTYSNFLSNSTIKPETSNYIRHIQTNVKYQKIPIKENNDESNSNDEDTPNFENTIIQTTITPIIQEEHKERVHTYNDPYISTKGKIKNGKFTDSESSNKFSINKNYKRDRLKVFSFGLGLDNLDQD